MTARTDIKLRCEEAGIVEFRLDKKKRGYAATIGLLKPDEINRSYLLGRHHGEMGLSSLGNFWLDGNVHCRLPRFDVDDIVSIEWRPAMREDRPAGKLTFRVNGARAFEISEREYKGTFDGWVVALTGWWTLLRVRKEPSDAIPLRETDFLSPAQSGPSYLRIAKEAASAGAKLNDFDKDGEGRLDSDELVDMMAASASDGWSTPPAMEAQDDEEKSTWSLGVATGSPQPRHGAGIGALNEEDDSFQASRPPTSRKAGVSFSAASWQPVQRSLTPHLTSKPGERVRVNAVKFQQAVGNAAAGLTIANLGRRFQRRQKTPAQPRVPDPGDWIV